MRSVLVAVGLSFGAPALACSFIGPEGHFIDTGSTDAVGPTVPEVGQAAIGRGQGPKKGLFTQSTSSCDDIGTISLPVSATDDVSPSPNIGFRSEVVDGVLPDGLEIDDAAIWRAGDGLLHWIWIDGATKEQEPFQFTLSVSSVDEAGNESSPTEVLIADEGAEGGGCDVAAGGFGLSTLLACLLVLRRR